MLEVCMLALPWMADPAVAGNPASRFQATLLTCARPVALLVEAQAVCAAAKCLPSDSPTVDAWLMRWQTASAQLPDCSRSEYEELRSRVREGFNEHALSAAEQFIGCIRA